MIGKAVELRIGTPVRLCAGAKGKRPGRPTQVAGMVEDEPIGEPVPYRNVLLILADGTRCPPEDVEVLGVPQEGEE